MIPVLASAVNVRESALVALEGMLTAPALLGTCYLFVVCVAIGVCDVRFMLIPNGLNAALGAGGLLWTGLIAHVLPLLRAVEMILSAGVMLGVAWTYRKLRRRHGLGMGDVKFVAAAAAWIGGVYVPWLVLMASVSGLIAVGVLRLAGRDMDALSRLPFGPFLCGALVVIWLVQRAGVS